jgi:hypothetical protein
MKLNIRATLGFALLCSCFAQSRLGLSSVNIEVINVNGEPVKSFEWTLTESGTKKIFGSYYDNRVANIPHGEYLVRVRAPGYRTVEQGIRVYQPEISLRFLSSVSNSTYGSIIGTLRSEYKQAGEFRVVLVAVPRTNTAVVETFVRQDGTFEFSGLDSGDYILLVLRGLTVLHSEPIRSLIGEKRLDLNVR